MEKWNTLFPGSNEYRKQYLRVFHTNASDFDTVFNVPTIDSCSAVLSIRSIGKEIPTSNGTRWVHYCEPCPNKFKFREIPFEYSSPKHSYVAEVVHCLSSFHGKTMSAHLSFPARSTYPVHIARIMRLLLRRFVRRPVVFVEFTWI